MSLKVILCTQIHPINLFISSYTFKKVKARTTTLLSQISCIAPEREQPATEPSKKYILYQHQKSWPEPNTCVCMSVWRVFVRVIMTRTASMSFCSSSVVHCRRFDLFILLDSCFSRYSRCHQIRVANIKWPTTSHVWSPTSCVLDWDIPSHWRPISWQSILPRARRSERLYTLNQRCC